MTEAQRLYRKLLDDQSKARGRMAELAGVDGALTPEQRSEMDMLENGTPDIERKLRASRASMDSEQTATIENPKGNPQQRELAELRSRVHLGDFVQAAAALRGVDGAAMEYSQALNIEAGRFPLSLLAPELRAETDVDGMANQQNWVDRLLAESLAMYLGVTFQSVAPGVSAHPVTTAGASGIQRARMEAVTATAWTVGTAEMKPKRNTALVIFSSEDAYRVPGLEDALRRDLQMGVMESIDKTIFNGDAGADGTDADIAGLNTLAGVEKTLTQALKVKAPETLAAFVELIDGQHATQASDLRVVASVGSNVLWSTTIHNATAENQTIQQFLTVAGIQWRTRADIDTATANGDFGAYIGRQRGIDGAGVAAVFSSGELIRDPYTSAKSGEVQLTLAYYWDFKLPRASNFARIKYVT